MKPRPLLPGPPIHWPWFVSDDVPRNALIRCTSPHTFQCQPLFVSARSSLGWLPRVAQCCGVSNSSFETAMLGSFLPKFTPSDTHTRILAHIDWVGSGDEIDNHDDGKSSQSGRSWDSTAEATVLVKPRCKVGRCPGHARLKKRGLIPASHHTSVNLLSKMSPCWPQTLHAKRMSAIPFSVPFDPRVTRV